ncbi:hypothetical protein ACFVVU_30530 [Kitasatospora sp. NPDC057965]|uniref:hypothetical protein n=1 Tax=Kitasatospora sp. NPDC057965 TaxID=3346291 RepID=UPI0036DB8E2C
MPDFHFHGWTPADQTSAAAQEDFLQADYFHADGMYEFIARTTSPDDLHEYLIYADKGADWDYPGQSRILSAHIELDTEHRTFNISRARRPTYELAAAWLISRGADPAAFRLALGEPGGPSTPHEAELLEYLLLHGEQYEVVETDTVTHQAWETWATLRDCSAEPTDETTLLLLQQQDFDDPGFRSTQLARFAAYSDAEDWLDTRPTPLVPARVGSTPVPDLLVPGHPDRTPVARPDTKHAARLRTITPRSAEPRLASEHGEVPAPVHQPPAGRSRP